MQFKIFALLLLIGLAVANPVPESNEYYDEECTDIDAEFAQAPDLSSEVFFPDVKNEAEATDAPCEDAVEEAIEPGFIDNQALKAFVETEATAAPTDADCVEEDVEESSYDYNAGHQDLPDLKQEFETATEECVEEEYDSATEAAALKRSDSLDVLSNAFAHVQDDAMVKLVGDADIDEIEGDCEELYE